MASSVSAAHKRWSQGEADKTVLDGDVVEAIRSITPNDPLLSPFLQALTLNRQPRISLHALYQGWIDTLLAFQAACKTGRFAATDSPELSRRTPRRARGLRAARSRDRAARRRRQAGKADGATESL